MKELLEKWQSLNFGWKMYLTGGALICVPIWANFDLSSAGFSAGIIAILGAAIWAVSNL